MTSLNERFLTFLEEEKPVEDRRSARGVVALLGGIFVLTLCVALAQLWRKLVAAPFLPVALWLMGWGLWQFLMVRRARWHALRVREIVVHGQRVNGFLVRASDGLYRPGTTVQHCQVLISFQPEVSGDREYMQHLAQRWAEQTSSREPRQLYRRRQLPLSLTDGSPVYCCDLFVHPGLLASGYLTSTVLPCIAELGEDGGIELVPYWLLFPYVESPLSQQHV